MCIRRATAEDYDAIRLLLDDIGFSQTQGFIYRKLKDLLNAAETETYVYVVDELIVGMISWEYRVLLHREGNCSRIQYLMVHHQCRGIGIGRALENFYVSKSRERGCEQMEGGCLEKQPELSSFFTHLGYGEETVRLIKTI